MRFSVTSIKSLLILNNMRARARLLHAPFIAIVWLACSAVFILRTPLTTASTSSPDDVDDDEAQAMLQPLNSMLNWGVANSDPEELKRVARMVEDGTAPPSNFDASVISALFPTPLLDMRGLNSLACNSSVNLDERLQSLEMLEELVQKRDNARGLSRLDSFACLKQLLTDDSSKLTSHALWVLGTASRHEPDVQLRMNDLGVVSALSSLLAPSLSSASASASGSGARVSAKLLYALGSALPGCDQCIRSFEEAGGLHELKLLVSAPSLYPLILVRKSVTLLTDVMLSMSETQSNVFPVAQNPEGGVKVNDDGGSATVRLDDSVDQAGSNVIRGNDDALTCAAAALMLGGSADVDLRQKSVELVMAIISKQQSHRQVVYAAPPCLSDAKTQLASWLKAQLQAGAASDDAVQQLEPLSDSLRALEKRLKEGNVGGGKQKKKKMRSVLGSQVEEEAGLANKTTPVMRIA